MSRTSKSKVAYWSVGVVLILWINFENHFFGGEGTFLPISIILLMGLPSSLIAYMSIYFLLLTTPLDGTDTSTIEFTFIYFIVLLAGHIQWFYFYLRLARSEGDNESIMINVKKLNAGNNNKDVDQPANKIENKQASDGNILDSHKYTDNYLGQRTRKVTSSGSTIYHYDQNGQLISETDSSGGDIRDIVYRGSIPVAQIDSSTTDTVTYLHTDHLGTPRMGTDATGEVVWKWSGEAFGGSAADRDPDGDGVNTVVKLRFPGQYFDGESGLYYNYFRYYDPGTGRYVSSDPIGLEGGLNTYGYVGGNPVTRIDPFGLF